MMLPKFLLKYFLKVSAFSSKAIFKNPKIKPITMIKAHVLAILIDLLITPY